MDIVFSATARVYTEHTQGHFVHRAIIMNVFKWILNHRAKLDYENESWISWVIALKDSHPGWDQFIMHEKYGHSMDNAEYNG